MAYDVNGNSVASMVAATADAPLTGSMRADDDVAWGGGGSQGSSRSSAGVGRVAVDAARPQSRGAAGFPRPRRESERVRRDSGSGGGRPAESGDRVGGVAGAAADGQAVAAAALVHAEQGLRPQASAAAGDLVSRPQQVSGPARMGGMSFARMASLGLDGPSTTPAFSSLLHVPL